MVDDDLVRQCAATVMDSFHLMMRTVGGEMRKRPNAEFTVHQFHALMTIKHQHGASLSQVSDHLGATLSSASKLIDGLVERGYVRRDVAADDRRRLILALTDAGEEAVNAEKLKMLSCLSEKLGTLSPGERAMLELAMGLLRSAVVSAQPGPSTSEQSTQQGEQQQ